MKFTLPRAVKCFDNEGRRQTVRKTENAELYMSHPAYGVRVVELPSGNTI